MAQQKKSVKPAYYPVVIVLLSKYKDEDTEVLGVYKSYKSVAKGFEGAFGPNCELMFSPGSLEDAAKAIAAGKSYESPDGKARYWTEKWSVR